MKFPKLQAQGMRFVIASAFLPLLLVTSGCGSSNESSSSADDAYLAKIYKFNEEIYCDSDSGIEIGVMEQELVDIGVDVVCSQEGQDGATRLAVCDSGTGNINVFTINSTNLPDAEDIGFNSVDELPNYIDEECEM